jgi:hypothetical protein
MYPKGRPLDPGRFLVHVSVRDWVDLRAIIYPKGRPLDPGRFLVHVSVRDWVDLRAIPKGPPFRPRKVPGTRFC